MLDHLSYQLRLIDKATADTLRIQCMDEKSPIYGSIEEISLGYNGAHSAIGAARQLIEGFYTPGCAYEGNIELIRRAILAMQFVLSMQHEDGTFDLLQTNFHDGAETAFTVQTFAPTYFLMKSRMGDTAEEKELDALSMRYINQSATGMINSGFHTPNHRWVISAALGMCYRLTGREDCLAHIHKFLNEGMDCDEEGEFTERSAGTYNIICDRALITMARMLDMPELYDHVTRNLNMVLKYFEPDHTVNTLNSTRQDVGTAPDWSIYYACYLYMALETGNQEFAYIADAMLAQAARPLEYDDAHAVPRFDYLPWLLMDEKLQNALKTIEPKKPEHNYVKHFVKSGIVRARKDDFTMTLIKERPMFCKIQYGTHEVYLRLAGCFYAKGQFCAQSLTPTDDGFEMKSHVRWGYKRPLEEKPETSDWRKMDHSKRADVNMQDFDFILHVKMLDTGIALDIDYQGVECVPTKLEIMLEPKGRYITDSMEMRARGGDYIYQKCDTATYQYPDYHTFTISGGYHEHYYGQNMRGTLQGDDKSVFVALTANTPVKQHVELTFA